MVGSSQVADGAQGLLLTALDDSPWSWASLRSDQQIGRRYEHPELGIQCVDNTLGIFVQTGGYVAENVWPDRIAVAYRFGDSDVVEQGWRELISGDEGNVGAWMPPSYRRALVGALPAHAEGLLVFRMWNFDDTEVGTMTGNSTGGCSFEPESGLVTSENHPVEVFDYGSEAFF